MFVWVGMVHSCACKVGASLLGADMACLASEAARAIAQGVHYLHLDVMDGHFVPNITMGPPVIKALRKHSTAFFGAPPSSLQADMHHHVCCACRLPHDGVRA